MVTATTLRELNAADQEEFVRTIGLVFENSPWVAAAAWSARPFPSFDTLYTSLYAVVDAAPAECQLALIRAHPDLVGKAARTGALTAQSQDEQAVAGLDRLSREESDAFNRYNAAYREKFGFPFVICARENKKEAILASFPVRLDHSREEEMTTALGEIGKIARLRLRDVLSPD